MKTETRPCLFCGALMVLNIAEPGEEPYTGTCTACSCEYDGYYVMQRLDGKLEGFMIGFMNIEEARHWLRAIVTECPEARNIVGEAMAELILDRHVDNEEATDGYER